MNSNRRTRTLLTLATDNWLSRAYLAVVAAATVFFLFDTFFVSHTDASMSGAVPWLLTAPLSFLYTLLPEGTLNGSGDGAFLALYLVGIGAAALANAGFMGFALRRIRPASGRATAGA
ncbi:SCO4225 family membrane protein [Streptomyces sp. NPDC000878]